MTTSGIDTEAAEKPPRKPETPATPEGSEVPEGFVLVPRKEHDAIQGDLRRTRKRLKDIEDEQEEKERRERVEAATAAGKFDEAVGMERQAREAAQRRADRAVIGSAITDYLLTHDFTGEQARAIKQLVDRDAIQMDDGEPVEDSVGAAVKAVLDRFPNLFKQREEEPTQPSKPGRRAGPATPPQDHRGGKPADYVSPEEYSETPIDVRYSPEFRERVKRSEAFWPKVIRRSDLQQDAS